MKVIKIVGEGAERWTYVEGGPECEECLNGKVGFGRRIIQPDNKIIWSEGYGECPACDGTGLIPVEQYSDEQLDVLLNTHFETWDLRMRRELHTNEPVYSIEGEPWTLNFPCAETSRGAKIAAVIAVAEEGK